MFRDLNYRDRDSIMDVFAQYGIRDIRQMEEIYDQFYEDYLRKQYYAGGAMFKPIEIEPYGGRRETVVDEDSPFKKDFVLLSPNAFGYPYTFGNRFAPGGPKQTVDDTDEKPQTHTFTNEQPYQMSKVTDPNSEYNGQYVRTGPVQPDGRRLVYNENGEVIGTAANAHPTVVVDNNGNAMTRQEAAHQYSSAYDGSIEPYKEVFYDSTIEPAMNTLSLSNNVGMVADVVQGRDAYDVADRYFTKTNSGLFTDNYAKEHPNVANAINTAVDIAAVGAATYNNGQLVKALPDATKQLGKNLATKESGKDLLYGAGIDLVAQQLGWSGAWGEMLDEATGGRIDADFAADWMTPWSYVGFPEKPWKLSSWGWGNIIPIPGGNTGIPEKTVRNMVITPAVNAVGDAIDYMNNETHQIANDNPDVFKYYSTQPQPTN